MRITDHIRLDERDLTERFVRASGPGGQNVNKVSTAVELRLDARGVAALPPAVRARLVRLAGRRMTAAGDLVIRADRFRTQEQNREDARSRLVELVREATVAPKARIKTRVPRAAKKKRLDAKGRRSTVKNLRRVRADAD
ncbi:MAG: alternative ribosome rescue aminoacyl-tRNA hydrolase ArfB [Hyphomicrobiaceae bacterium]